MLMTWSGQQHPPLANDAPRRKVAASRIPPNTNANTYSLVS